MRKDFIGLVVTAFSILILLTMYLCGIELALKYMLFCVGMLIVKFIFFIKNYIVVKIN